MDKLFVNKWVLRIFSLVLAIVLFIYVSYEEKLDGENASIAKESVEVITGVPLEAYYDKENLIVSGLPETVNVTISGPSTIVLKTKINQDFTLFVDLNDLLIGEHQVTIQDENISDKLEVTIDPVTVNVTIEEKVTKQYKVEPEINNTLIEDGYILDEMSVKPDIVNITGAKSIIDSINFVKATVKAEAGIKQSFNQQSPVRVLNDELDSLDVIVEPENVEITVNVKEYSRNVPVTIKQTGTLPENIEIVSFIPESKELKVFGKKAIIDELTGLVVEFDVSALSESGTYNATIIVPDGVKTNSKTLKLKTEVRKGTSSEATQNDENLE